MIVHNNKVVVNNGRWINCSQPYSIKRHVNILSNPGGTITAEPVEGYDGYVVKLSHTDNSMYTFMNYNVSGARLYNDRYFRFEGSDVTVSGTWEFASKWLCENWVKIGNQIWTSKNLEYDDGGTGITKLNITANGHNLGTQYYYSKRALLRIADQMENHGLFSGWSIPHWYDYYKLVNYIKDSTNYFGDKLKSTYGWDYYNSTTYGSRDGNGTDNFGFTGLPTGRWIGSRGSGKELFDVGKSTAIWGRDVASTADEGWQWYMLLSYGVEWSDHHDGYADPPDSTVALKYDKYAYTTNTRYHIRLIKNNSTPPVCV